MKKSLLLLSAGIITAATFLQGCKGGPGGSGDAITLKMNLAPGTKYAYSMDMKMNMEQSMMGQSMKTEQNMTMDFTYDVAAAEGTDKKFTVTYDRLAMAMKSPMMSMEYDSKDGAKKDSTLAPLGMMLNKPFSMTVSEKGEIKKIEGLDAILNSLVGTGTPQDEAIRKQLASSFNDTAIRNMMQQSFDIYPDKAVKPGDTWNKVLTINMGPFGMKLDNTYKLTSVSNGTAHLDVVSKITSDGSTMEAGGQQVKMDISGDSKGTMDVEVATGFMSDSKIKQTIKGNISAAGMAVPMNIVNDIHTSGKKQ